MTKTLNNHADDIQTSITTQNFIVNIKTEGRVKAHSM